MGQLLSEFSFQKQQFSDVYLYVLLSNSLATIRLYNVLCHWYLFPEYVMSSKAKQINLTKCINVEKETLYVSANVAWKQNEH